MTPMKQTVVGFFSKPSDAQEAVKQLTSNGFSSSDVDLSLGTSSSNTAAGNRNFNLDSNSKDEKESGVARFFKNLFGADDDNDTNVSRYSRAANGNSIVTVHASSSDEAERAADLLDQYGAINVDEDAEGYDSYDTTTGAAPVGAFNETAGASASTTEMDTTTGTFDTTNRTTSFRDEEDVTGATSLPVIEEELQVGKRTVETGGVRLRSRIIERPVEENLRLREERVYVNRNPVNRAATSADFDTFREGEVELREHAEVPVVSKEARIVEEVSLGKEINERTETIRDTVRNTEVDVENIESTTRKTTGGSSSDESLRSGN